MFGLFKSPPFHNSELGELVRSRGLWRGSLMHSSIYVPKPAYRKLREIALARECKVHDLILDGIDVVLREHGHPTTAELKRRSAIAP